MDNSMRDFSARTDPVDLRDYIYRPSLRLLPANYVSPVLLSAQSTEVGIASRIKVRDQGDGPTCVGQAIASAIDIQRLQSVTETRDQANKEWKSVSAEMLYCMAVALEEDHAGPVAEPRKGGLLSLRSGLKAFFNCGACLESSWDLAGPQTFASLSGEAVEEARVTTLGAYFRVPNTLNDFHSALVDTGALLTSAYVHDGWKNPVAGCIETTESGWGQQSHAFVIVGYTPSGFLVLNSFGPDWGAFDFNGTRLPGVALWSYEDWANSVRDAWVLRLGVPAPEAFRFTIGSHGKPTTGATELGAVARDRKMVPSTPRLAKVVGRYLNFRDGRFRETGTFPASEKTLRQTLDILEGRSANSAKSPYYGDVVLHFFGIPESLAETMEALDKTVVTDKADGVYRIGIVWCGELLESVMHAITPLMAAALKRANEPGEDCDRTIERLVSPIGRAVWRDVKEQARRLIEGSGDKGFGDLARAIFQIAKSCETTGRRLHIVADAIGALPVVECMDLVMRRSRPKDRITLFAVLRSIQLIAPTIPQDRFERVSSGFCAEWRKRKQGARLVLLRPDASFVRLINLRPYSRTWTHLVQTAFEERPTIFIGDLSYNPPPQLKIHTEDLFPDFDFQEPPSFRQLFGQKATSEAIRKTILGFQAFSPPAAPAEENSQMAEALDGGFEWHSLHIGCSIVDPAYYGAVEPLAACNNDARAMAALAQQSGFDAPVALLDKAATRAAVIGEIRKAAEMLRGGDVFLLTYSGHGSTATDINGDETGGKLDQTWCLHDGELIDDELVTLWKTFAAGVRIYIISDSCHSGSVLSAPRTLPPAMLKDGVGRARRLPQLNELAVLRNKRQDKLQREESEPAVEVEASVMLLSACKDTELAYELKSVVPYGALTCSILQSVTEGRGRTFNSLFEDAKQRLDKFQTPQLATFGTASPRLADQPLFGPAPGISPPAAAQVMNPRDLVLPRERPGIAFLTPGSVLDSARLDGILAGSSEAVKKALYAKVTEKRDALNALNQAVCLVFAGEGELEHRGTGFLIAPDSVMTNNHVVKDFCAANNWTLKDGHVIEFRFFNGAIARATSISAPEGPKQTSDDTFDWLLKDVASVNITWIAGGPAAPAPLSISRTPLAPGAMIAAIGFPVPAGQRGWTLAFGTVDEGNMLVKRLMPGIIKDIAPVDPGTSPSHIGYDCSTDNGASGSAIIELESCALVGIHIGTANNLNYGHGFAQLNWPP